ncbi:chemotaxis protein CheA [Thiohalobacter sp. IOR34]|uniref:chemotaxis protein CheA n=1 Tax=Thiohalobacter sp. IOR34 TaxID=3057176 RepID=UPI0025B22CDD|nr:chemotaxis protein CheA [Thiohalobacter sp. IOR34]WJW76423.1 chemotaxis protein CheA [Thiohalobacter sp. IOR34]
MSIDMSQFHQVFFEESFEGLENMESALLSLGQGEADPELINTIFRAAHSIKGGSGTFGFTEIAEFTHVMETLLDEMRDGRREVTGEAVDLLLESVDVVRDMLAAVRDGLDPERERIAAAKSSLDALLSGGSGDQPAQSPLAEAEAVQPGGKGWRIRFRPYPHLMQTGNDPVRMFRELATLGELQVEVDISGLPAFEDLLPEEAYLSWTLTLQGEVQRQQIDEIFEWVDGDCELHVEALAEEQPEESEAAASTAPAGETAASADRQPATARGAGRSKPSASESSSIRVGIDKIDALINIVGELVITQSMLGQVGRGDFESFDHVAFERLRDGLADLERNTRELQEGVMRIRMLPISFSFNRFPRLVHDLSQKLGKKVELRLSGEQTELDKTVLEKIGDPLVHLVRNSMDHGIETPEARQAAGKPETGVLHLNAYHQGGNIVIEISDDGAGFNHEKIRAKAVERGIIGEDEELSEEEIGDLIFQPGFSTADEISDVSGRGVGMDVVRRNIKDLGGTVEVSSRPGEGTTFTIRLPLTLAILDGQLVQVGDQIYIIPLVSIVESLQIEPRRLNSVAGQADVYNLRDEYVPVINLHDLFDVEARSGDFAESLLVVVEGTSGRVGLVIDDLLSQQQVVIKSLESNFRPVEGLSGATILGDGTVALIIDVAGLIELGRNRPGSGRLHLLKGDAA